MRRITSALYVDVDNIASGLLKADRGIGLAFRSDPSLLVRALTTLDDQDGCRRDLLVRRAYLNPAGTIPDPDDPEHRLPVSSWRGPLTRAGFEVVDCPTLAPKTKNAADIRMVVDVLDATNAAVRFDEFIVASSDSDFTPLLHRLRAADRRTTIVTATAVAQAYGAAADRRVGGAELLTLMAPAPSLRAVPETGRADRALERRAVKALTTLLAGSPEPITLSSAGKAMRDASGTDEVSATRWFGHRTLTGFIQERITNLAVDPTYVWDPARHARPKAS